MTVDLTKHAREIGRALRNGKFEATPGGVLIDSGGMNLLANGAFKSTLYRGDEREVAIDPNLVVDQDRASGTFANIGDGTSYGFDVVVKGS